jgi:hypothetical protein
LITRVSAFLARLNHVKHQAIVRSETFRITLQHFALMPRRLCDQFIGMRPNCHGFVRLSIVAFLWEHFAGSVQMMVALAGGQSE